MTQTRKTTTLTAQQLLERHHAGEVFDGLAGDSGGTAAITGPISDTIGFVRVETEFGVLRYEPDQELEVLELPDREPAAQDEGRAEPVVRLEVTENLTHLLEMPLSRYQELLEEGDGFTGDGSPLSDVVSSATSGSSEPGVAMISTSVDDRWIRPVDGDPRD